MPYCHVVFTLPSQLIPLVFENAGVVYNVLFQAASEALLTIAADPNRMGAESWFPCRPSHLESKARFASPPTLPRAGRRSVQRPLTLDSQQQAVLPARSCTRQQVRNQFLKLLVAAWRTGKLRLTGSVSHLRQATAFSRLVSQLKRLKWVVYAKRPFGGPEYVLKYLARYTHRVAISSGRLISFENGKLTFRWRDSANGIQQRPMTLDAVEFIRRFLQHVLPPGFVKIRHFGLLADPCRKKSLLTIRVLLGSGAEPEITLSTQQRAALDRRCTVCGTGTLIVLGWYRQASQYSFTPDSTLPDDTEARTSREVHSTHQQSGISSNTRGVLKHRHASSQVSNQQHMTERILATALRPSRSSTPALNTPKPTNPYCRAWLSSNAVIGNARRRSPRLPRPRCTAPAHSRSTLLVFWFNVNGRGRVGSQKAFEILMRVMKHPIVILAGFISVRAIAVRGETHFLSVAAKWQNAKACTSLKRVAAVIGF